MGASCGVITCQTKKNSKYQRPPMVRRPTQFDLSASDAEGDEVDPRLTVCPPNEQARIGVPFQLDELIKSLPPT